MVILNGNSCNGEDLLNFQMGFQKIKVKYILNSLNYSILSALKSLYKSHE